MEVFSKEEKDFAEFCLGRELTDEDVVNFYTSMEAEDDIDR